MIKNRDSDIVVGVFSFDVDYNLLWVSMISFIPLFNGHQVVSATNIPYDSFRGCYLFFIGKVSSHQFHFVVGAGIFLC